MAYPVLDAQQTAELLPYGPLADEIAVVLGEFAAGTLRIAERTALPLAAGTLLTMPASDSRLSITKVVTVHPGNAERGLPTINGEMIVAQATDGTRLGLLHGATVTRRRTAALSLLAARYLLRDRVGPLLVFGAGDQAEAHIEAFHQEFGPREVLLSSRSRPRAERLVSSLKRRGIAANVAEDPTAAAAVAAVIVTATTSAVPVLRVRPRNDALICAIGAFRHDMAELGAELVGSAGLVVVDTLAGAQAEAGELIQAAQQGVWSWQQAVPLVALIASGGRQAGPSHSIFKSVGHAMYDLAAARVAFPD